MLLPALALSLWLSTSASLPTDGGARPGTPAVAPRAGWTGLGGSEPGPHSIRAQGSASGGGARSTPGLWIARPLIDGAGNPVITWADPAGVHVARFQNGAWTDLPFGASARWDESGFPLVSTPAVALDPKGRVLVAWIEHPPRERKRLRLFLEKSGGWDDLTPSRQPEAPWCARWSPEFGSLAAEPTLAIDGAGRAATRCIVFRTPPSKGPRMQVFPSPPPGPPAIEVQRWDGKRWQKLPLIDLGTESEPATSAMALALDATGAPVLLAEERGQDPAEPRLTRVLRGVAGRWERVPVDDGLAPVWLSSGGTAVWRASPSQHGALELRPVGADSQKTKASLPPPLSLQLTEPLASAIRWPLAVQFFIGRDGKVLATWLGGHSRGRNTSVYAALWTGTAWEDLGSTVQVHGGLSRTPGHSHGAAVALDSRSRPVVAWIDNSSGAQQVYLRGWSGTAWEELGGSAQGLGISGEETSPNAIAGVTCVSLALTRDDRPVVAWLANRPGRVVPFVRVWDGKSWVALPTPSDVDPHPSHPIHVTVSSQGFPVIGYATGGLEEWVVSRWDGTRWHASKVDGQAGTWSLFTTASGGLGRWMQDDSGQLHLTRSLDAQATPELFPAPGRRVHSREEQDGAELRLDASGRPVVAWEDARSGEILLLRWTGTAWEELSGSASGGGISRSAAPSASPALAVGAQTCVAWSEHDMSSAEIFLRCHPQ